ncbi:HNH endonuclease signature motif containing protein [uncultured Gimesia sp.]|uniref:HNH endonuclease n=1 Tax=uncultured Gimesia sp. TaxID=1678688 RepID=UPI002602F0B7|nr:HNH endonuclease signature motif containing protein [uncultured Gimesia sp.]
MSALPQCYRFTQPQTVPHSPEVEDDNEPDVLTLELSGSFGTLTRKQYRRKLWERLPHCRFCGNKISQYKNATLDHLQPQAQGGGDQLWNLVLSCQQCNTTKANRTIEQWASDILDGAEPVVHQQ